MSIETRETLAEARKVYEEVLAMGPPPTTARAAKKAFAKIERAHVRSIRKAERARRLRGVHDVYIEPREGGR